VLQEKTQTFHLWLYVFVVLFHSSLFIPLIPLSLSDAHTCINFLAFSARISFLGGNAGHQADTAATCGVDPRPTSENENHSIDGRLVCW
jgi:hypothetical protein